MMGFGGHMILKINVCKYSDTICEKQITMTIMCETSKSDTNISIQSIGPGCAYLSKGYVL